MKLKKETDRKFVELVNYRGTCNRCGTPVEYPKMLVVEIADEGNKKIVIPIDIYYCPYCYKTIGTMNIYISMDVTEELDGIKNDISN